MATTLKLVHHEHFDLLLPADAPEGGESLGTYTVLNREGDEEERGKYRFESPDNTTVVELPEDFDPSNLTALMHLVQTLTDRHSDAATGVWGTEPMVTTKVAALLGCPVLQEEPEAPVQAEEASA